MARRVSAPKRQAHKLIWGIKGQIDFISAKWARFWQAPGTSGRLSLRKCGPRNQRAGGCCFSLPVLLLPAPPPPTTQIRGGWVRKRIAPTCSLLTLQRRGVGEGRGYQFPVCFLRGPVDEPQDELCGGLLLTGRVSMFLFGQHTGCWNPQQSTC